MPANTNSVAFQSQRESSVYRAGTTENVESVDDNFVWHSVPL